MLDTMVAAFMVAATWMIDYRLPQAGVKAKTFQKVQEVHMAQEVLAEQQKELTVQSVVAQPEQEGVLTKTTETSVPDDEAKYGETDTVQGVISEGITNEDAQGVSTEKTAADPPQDWHVKFADKFTDEMIATDTSYSSPNLAIQLSYQHYDTGILDKTDSGKHKKYGTQISYVLADIYVGDITCFQTAFARDIYGIGYSEKLSGISDRMRAVLAVNGDSYSNNRHKNNGTIIRNGVVYRNRPTNSETCVLNLDGTMDIYEPGQIDLGQLMDKGAYQSWIFGPSLLDKEGKAKEEFLTWDYIRQSHPRTAIGYYEPGHYCLLLVDGRQENTRGMFLEEMAQLFEELGCKAAYNLDGGHCSFMTFQGRMANQPYKPEQEVADGIVFTEGL